MRYKRLSAKKVDLLLRCFCEDLTATATASILGVNRNTVNSYFRKIRERIFQQSLKESPLETDEFELDEPYFGAKRVRGKRRRGAAGKTSMFGLFKREGNVFVTVVSHCSKEALMPIIRGKILEGSTIHTDGWKAYDGLILNGYDHYRVFHHAKNLQEESRMSMELKRFGVMPKDVLPSSTAVLLKPLSSIERKPNSGTIIAR
jgi:transposase-like protein